MTFLETVSSKAGSIAARSRQKMKASSSTWPLTGPTASPLLLETIRTYCDEATGSPAVLLSSGRGNFALQLSHVLADLKTVSDRPAVAEAMKGCAGDGALVPAKSEVGEHPANFGHSAMSAAQLDARWSPLNESGLQSAQFTTVIVEDTGIDGLGSILVEAQRLLRPDGTCILMGYFSPQVLPVGLKEAEIETVAAINACVADGIESYLRPALSAGERDIQVGYRNLSLGMDEGSLDQPTLIDDGMEAFWSLSELIEQIDTWTAVRRLESAEATEAIEVWKWRAALKRVWGNPKKQRPINWPVALRVGHKLKAVAQPNFELDGEMR